MFLICDSVQCDVKLPLQSSTIYLAVWFKFRHWKCDLKEIFMNYLWKLGMPMIHEHNLVRQYTQYLGIVEYWDVHNNKLSWSVNSFSLAYMWNWGWIWSVKTKKQSKTKKLEHSSRKKTSLSTFFFPTRKQHHRWPSSVKIYNLYFLPLVVWSL